MLHQLLLHRLRNGNDQIRTLRTLLFQSHQLGIGIIRSTDLQAVHVIDHGNAFPLNSHSSQEAEPVVGHAEMKRPFFHEPGCSQLV